MLGIAREHLEPIYRLAKILDPDCNNEKLGAWGILFLCSGAMAGGNSLWQDRIQKSDIFVCASDLTKVLQGSEVCTSDDYAIRFSERIKEWCNSDHAIAVAEQRMDKFRDKLSDRALLCYKRWLTLAYMLNSLQDISKKDLLGFDCQRWVSVSSPKSQIYGWPELFFAAGLLLNAEVTVSWDKMASAIHGMNQPYKEDVSALFEHYAGKTPFSKSGYTRVRTDQLKKGVRIRMKNGWEAVVVEACKGNTLIAKVFGDYTETGSVYAHDIAQAEVNGKWVEVEMTEEQAQYHKEFNQFFNGEPDS